MAVTLEALIDRRTPPAAAVVTTDGAAWSWPELFDHFAPAIHSFARSRGVSSPEDIVQDVFTAAVERFPRFEGDSSGLRSFLFTLAYRRIADEHRSSYRRSEKLVADHVPTADESVGIEDSVTEVESASEAMQALDILNERERRVIAMRIIDEASPAEVAASMGLSNGNVRVIQARALMKIRKYLESTSGSMPSIGLVFAFVSSLRTELPADGGLAAWMDLIHAESTRDPARVAATGAGSAIAAGSASTTTIVGAALKVGLVVALATASTSAVYVDDPARQAGLRAPAGAASVVPLEEDTQPVGFTVPSAVVDAPNFDAGIEPIAPNRPDLVPPSEPVGVQPSAETDQTEDESLAEDPEVGSDPDGAAGTEAHASDAVTSTVDDVTDTVVEDVVVPVVDAVVDVVDNTVTTVTETVVDTVDTAAGVVDDTTNTVDDTVDTVTDVVDGTVDTATDVVDDVLGGLFG